MLIAYKKIIAKDADPPAGLDSMTLGKSEKVKKN